MIAAKTSAGILAVTMATFALPTTNKGSDNKPLDAAATSIVVPATAPAPPRIDEAHEAVGAFVYGGDKRVQLIEVVWGIDSHDNIGFAVFRGVDEDGTVYDYEHPENYKRIAFSTSELRGAYIQTQDGRRVLVDELCYTLTADGFLTPLTLSGSTEFYDSPILYFQQGLPYCCQPITRTECINDSCTASCPGLSNCNCTNGGSGCVLDTFQICKGKCGGTCPGGTNDTCNQTSSNPINCSCGH